MRRVKRSSTNKPMKFTQLHSWAVLVVAGTAAAMWMVGRSATGQAGSGTTHVPLRVGYALEAPYVYLDAQGQVSGESPEVLRALLRQIGAPQPQWIHQEFSTLIHELEIGRIDVIAAGLFITPERSRKVAFTRPTVAVQMGLLVANGNPRQVSRLQDLAENDRLRLAVIEDSVQAQQAQDSGLSNRQLLRVPDAQTGFAAVRSGLATAMALPAPSLRWLLGQAHGKGGLEVLDLADDPGSTRIDYPAFAWRLDDPRRDRIDDQLAEFIGRPEHIAIEQRHGMSVADIELARRWKPSPQAQAPAGLGVRRTAEVRP
jgi:polar amino acid transport system substrate-binding protein